MLTLASHGARGLSLRTLVLVGLATDFAAWLFQFGLAGRVIDAKGLDLLFLLRGSRPVPKDLVIVAVDEPAFAELRLQWPWPRSLHARLIERLRAAGARVIVFDVLFSEPSKAEEDAVLIDAVGRARNVVLASDLRVVETPAVQQTLQVMPLPALVKVAAGVGIVNLPQDSDGVIRRARLVVSGFPSLAAAASKAAGWQGRLTDAPFLINYLGHGQPSAPSRMPRRSTARRFLTRRSAARSSSSGARLGPPGARWTTLTSPRTS